MIRARLYFDLLSLTLGIRWHRLTQSLILYPLPFVVVVLWVDNWLPTFEVPGPRDDPGSSIDTSADSAYRYESWIHPDFWGF